VLVLALPAQDPQPQHLVDELSPGAMPGAAGVLANAKAWRWFGGTAVQDGRLTRLPAETFGLLPALSGANAPARA
jgi:hypothetical protein